ncbi:MAG: hypothetical protein ACI4PF_02220 [Christensenellales bacterium]
MIQKLMNQQSINNFHVQGRLVEDPIKKFNEENKIFVFFKIRTKFNNSYVDIPMVITGRDSDVFATIYAQGDQIAVDGMFISLNRKTLLWITQHRLVKKYTKGKKVIDEFKETVELYSLEGIERRKNNNE